MNIEEVRTPGQALAFIKGTLGPMPRMRAWPQALALVSILAPRFGYPFTFEYNDGVFPDDGGDPVPHERARGYYVEVGGRYWTTRNEKPAEMLFHDPVEAAERLVALLVEQLQERVEAEDH